MTTLGTAAHDNERAATEEEFDGIMKDIHYEFVKDGGIIQCTHKV